MKRSDEARLLVASHSVASVSRRQWLAGAIGVAICTAAGHPAGAAGSYRIVAPDWAAAESLLAVGVVPLAVADTRVYREWLPEIPLPADVLDLGSRAEPNLELIASLRPDRILISNWQANLKVQFERIALTDTVAIINPPVSPLESARQALRQVAQPLGKEPDAARYLGAFDKALAALAQTPRKSDDNSVIIGVLHENGRQLYAYGEGSWVHEILIHLGLRNGLKAKTSRFGNALIDLAQLATGPESHLFYLEQGARTRRAERLLHQSTLWRNLPMVRAGRTHAIPAFYALGGVPSAWFAARVISTAMRDVAGQRMADVALSRRGWHLPMLPVTLVGLACVAVGLTVSTLRAVLPVGLWWDSLISPGTDVQALIFSDMVVPRIAVSLIVGAALGLSGTLLQQVLRNPLADTTTLGISSGAYLALATVSLFAPSFLNAGQEPIALLGSAATTAIVFATMRRGDFSPTSVILAGLTLSLVCGAAGAMLTVLNHEYLSTLFIWQTGSLIQNGWGTVYYLLPRMAICAVAILLLQRPLSLLGLGDSQARGFGLSINVARGGMVCLAAAIGAFSVSAVGVIGFIGLAAPQIALLLGARTMGQRLLWAPVMGAVLLWLTDQCVQHLPMFHAEIPTGSATAVIGAPVLLLILLRHRSSEPEDLHRTSFILPRTAQPVILIALLVALFVLLTAVAVGLGNTPTGWQWISFETANNILPWRAPRVVTAGSAGAMLAVAGLLLQRLTGNPMASPEVLGISSGAALGVIVLLFFIPGFSEPLMTAAACAGALGALFFVMILNWRSGFSPGRLLLVGVALATVFSALAAVLLTSGDPRSAILLTWMSGSTYRASWQTAQVAASAAALLVVATCTTLRWLAIIPLGITVTRSIGAHALASRLVIVSLTAVLTAAATLIVGPLSFVGLMGPHIVRALGIHRPFEQIVAAVAVGGALMIAADWAGRNIFFPWQAPAGLLAALIGGPLYLWLLRKRTA